MFGIDPLFEDTSYSFEEFLFLFVNGLVVFNCLKFIDEASEHMICLAIIADAWREVIVFVRWLVALNFERALLVTTLSDLLLRLSALFDQTGGLSPGSQLCCLSS